MNNKNRNLKSGKGNDKKKGFQRAKRTGNQNKEKGLTKQNFAIEYFDVVPFHETKSKEDIKTKKETKQGTKRKQERKTRRLRTNKWRHSKINKNALLGGKQGLSIKKTKKGNENIKNKKGKTTKHTKIQQYSKMSFSAISPNCLFLVGVQYFLF